MTKHYLQEDDLPRGERAEVREETDLGKFSSQHLGTTQSLLPALTQTHTFSTREYKLQHPTRRTLKGLGEVLATVLFFPGQK